MVLWALLTVLFRSYGLGIINGAQLVFSSPSKWLVTRRVSPAIVHTVVVGAVLKRVHHGIYRIWVEY